MLIVICFFFTGNIVTGQVSTSIDVRLPSDQGYGSVNYNNPSALGAKKQVIITQFLIEAIILTFVGGVVGICLGVFASYLYAYFTASSFVVSLPSILLAFAVSVGIGVLFGWYPAKRAADLQPIEALRYE